MELTLSIIKPDAVKRGLTGEINSLIEKKKNENCCTENVTSLAK